MASALYIWQTQMQFGKIFSNPDQRIQGALVEQTWVVADTLVDYMKPSDASKMISRAGPQASAPGFIRYAILANGEVL